VEREKIIRDRKYWISRKKRTILGYTRTGEWVGRWGLRAGGMEGYEGQQRANLRTK